MDELTNVVPEEAVDTVVEEAVANFDAKAFGEGVLVGTLLGAVVYFGYKGGKWLVKKGKALINRHRQAKAIEEDYESDGFEEA